MLYSLDIETACAEPTCTHPDNFDKCKHALDPMTARITQIALWAPEGDQVVFQEPLGFSEWYQSQDEEPTFVGHNFKFDLKHLRSYDGLEDLGGWAHDTQIMAHICTHKVSEQFLIMYEEERTRLNKGRSGNPHRKAKGLSLKTLAPFFLDVPAFWEPEHHDDAEYALKDAEYTYKLFLYFKQNMSEAETDFYSNKAMPWASMLLDSEEAGITINKSRLHALKSALKDDEATFHSILDERWEDAHVAWQAKKANDVREKYLLQKTAGSESWKKRLDVALSKVPTKVDLDSPSQVAWLLRDHLKLDIRDFVGDDSTGKSVLTRLAAEGHSDVETYLNWRKTQKLLTAFLPDYEDRIRHDGKIHASFNITGTRTGRLSSSDPNLQQVSKKLKSLFVPRPGYKFIGYDAAAIEAKIIAWYTEDPTLYQLIASGASIHDHNVNVFFDLNTPLGEVKTLHPQERKVVKNVGFACFYGAGPNRIFETMLAGGFSVSQSDCRRIYESIKSSYPGVFSFHRDITQAFEKGEVITNALGRPIKIQHWESAFMKGFNTLVQSTASDINMQGAFKAREAWKRAGLDATLLLFVHDFVLAEVSEEHLKPADEILVKALTDFKLETKHGLIPLTVDGGISDEWT